MTVIHAPVTTSALTLITLSEEDTLTIQRNFYGKIDIVSKDGKILEITKKGQILLNGKVIAMIKGFKK